MSTLGFMLVMPFHLCVKQEGGYTRVWISGDVYARAKAGA